MNDIVAILVPAYLLIVNALGLILMLVDKKKAQRSAWRIPEATLMLVAALGGSIGSLWGMYWFRHKTKHPKFYLGIPAILILQIALTVYLFLR